MTLYSKLFLTVLFFINMAQAAGSEADSSKNQSHFRLVTSECRESEDAAPESTPQSPPLNIDNPETPGCNHWEINVVADGDVSNHEKEFNLPLLEINYGVGDNFQLKYEVHYSYSTADGESKSKIGESKVGVKYAFYSDDSKGLDLAFYPQLALSDPPSDAEGSHRLETLTVLPALLSKKIGRNAFGDLELTANSSYTFSTVPETKNYISAGVGLGMPMSNSLGVMGEIATEQATARSDDGVRAAVVKMNLGIVTALSKSFLVFGALGHSLTSSDGSDHKYAVVGFRLLAHSR